MKWVRLHDRVSSGEMPPPEKKHDLSDEARAGFVALLGQSLAESDRESDSRGGKGPVRRLTRVEYEHRVRDLLALPALDIRDKLRKTAMRTDLRESPNSSTSRGCSSRDGSTRPRRPCMLRSLLVWLRCRRGNGVSPARIFFPPRDLRRTRGDVFRAGWKTRRDRRKTFQEMTPEQRLDPTLEMALFRSATWPYYGYPRGFRAEHDGEYRVRFSGRAVRQVAGFRLVPAHQPQAMSFRARQPSGPDVSGDVRETGGWIDLVPEPREFETTVRLKKGETFEYSPLGLPVPFIRTDGGFFYDFPPMPPEGIPGSRSGGWRSRGRSRRGNGLPPPTASSSGTCPSRPLPPDRFPRWGWLRRILTKTQNGSSAPFSNGPRAVW